MTQPVISGMKRMEAQVIERDDGRYQIGLTDAATRSVRWHGLRRHSRHWQQSNERCR
jgi:hypothetical protein